MKDQFVIGTTENVGAGSVAVRLDSESIAALSSHSDAGLSRAGTIGSQVKIASGKTWVIGTLRDLMIDRSDGMVTANVDFVGESEQAFSGGIGNFRRGVTAYPRPGAEVLATRRADLVEMFSPGTRPHIDIGTVHPTGVKASVFIDTLLSRNFAILGSTGSGKSTATALLLHRILDKAPEGHVIVIDPHGEYAGAFESRGVISNVDNLALPYWLMNGEEHCEVFVTGEGSDRDLECDILLQCLLQVRSKSFAAQDYESVGVDSPIPYLMTDLIDAVQGMMGRLDYSSEMARYMRLKNRIIEVSRDTRYSFMFGRDLANDTLNPFLAKVLRLPAHGRPISIVDLSGAPSDIVSVVVSILSRIVLDFAIWSQEDAKRPVLLVCEEAHRYVPAERFGTGRAVRKALERIAKEGRKYGVSLGLVTQRPSDLAEGALSQCGTIIAMRLNNDRDQACVRDAMPEGGRGLMESIPALRSREAVICGEGVPIPMRVRFDDLDEEYRPSSDDPVFSTLWRETGNEAEILARTIKRWRARSR